MVEDSTPVGPPSSPAAALSARALATLAVALGLFLFLTAGAISQLLNPAFGIWFTEVFVFLGLGWVLLRATGRDPLRATGLAHGEPLPSLFGFLLGLVNFFALVVPIQFAMQALAPEWLVKMFDASKLFEGQTALEMVLIVTGVSVAAPVCEEFFFRGIIQRNLAPPVLSRLGAIGVTAVIFSAFHLDPVGFLARVELGVLFGLLLVRTNSLWPSILAHSANNLISTILFLFAREADMAQTEAEADPLAVLAFAVVGGAILWGLLALARRHPSLWGKAAAEEPSQPAPRPRPSLARLVLPWTVGAVLSLALLAAVDSRGIRLSWLDSRYPLTPVPEDAPAARHAERTALEQLRAQARRGEVPLGEYEEERARQAREERERYKKR
ncbi:type II CAAX endopeptidase family protein [Myxococcaceae bacterium GXIMD 01537]